MAKRIRKIPPVGHPRRVAVRDSIAAPELPEGYTVTTRDRTPCAGVAWVVTEPNGRQWTCSGAFYDDHDYPGESAHAAVLAWGRVAVHRGTFRAVRIS